jgi:hypothetical protein
MASWDYSRLRAAQADRERAVDVLKAAFAEGRLDQHELTDRVALAHRSRTYGELAELTADLPVGPLGTLAQPMAAPYTPMPYPNSWPAIPEPDEPPLSQIAGAALGMAAVAPLIGGLSGPPALLLGFWAIADIADGRRSGMFWALLALLFGAVGTALFITDWAHWAHLIFG